MDIVADFKSRIDQFLEKTGMAASTFGQAVLEDPCFVADLREGREPRQATIKRVDEFMEKYEIPGSIGNGVQTGDPSRSAVG